MIIIWLAVSVVGLIVVVVVLAVNAARRRPQHYPYDSSYTYDSRYKPPEMQYPQPGQRGSAATALIIAVVAIGLLALGALFAYLMLRKGPV